MVLKFKRRPEVTVCTACRHFKNLEPGSPRAGVWYNHICLATPLPKKVDPYDGQLKPYAVNDLGREAFADKEFQYCREVNDGKCSKFEERVN